MSKFLKFIVHFIVICTIVCVVGLAVPPFLGITTEIMDDSGKETNLPMGSVTYAIPVKIKEAAVGDSILYQTDSKAYRYMITEMDKKNHIFKVIDSSDKDAEPVAVEVKDYIPKVVITVGYAGYLLLATESIEGLIILGLAVLFLVILYIVAELLKKEPQDDYDETDTEPGYVKSKKELKREEKAREKRYKEEERQIKKEERARRKGKAPERKKIKTGGFVDEIYEVKDWINSSFEVVEVRDYLRHPKPSGYRSLHVIIKVDGCFVEIQVRTIALDFWANLEHQIHYKKDVEDEKLIRSELKRCADEIASLDLSFQTIKDRIEG